MNSLWSEMRSMFRQLLVDIHETWALYRRLQGKGKKHKVLLLLYMNIVVLAVFLIFCYVSALYVLFGIVGGIWLGIKESPWWFLLTLLPPFAFLLFHFVLILGKTHYRKVIQNYRKRHLIIEDK